MLQGTQVWTCSHRAFLFTQPNFECIDCHLYLPDTGTYQDWTSKYILCCSCSTFHRDPCKWSDGAPFCKKADPILWSYKCLNKEEWPLLLFFRTGIWLTNSRSFHYRLWCSFRLDWIQQSHHFLWRVVVVVTDPYQPFRCLELFLCTPQKCRS